MEKSRFLGLDGLRGLCAIAVVLYHSELLFRPGVIVCHGYLAVDMFFILSGFVISARYDARFAAGLDAITFLKMRVRRLAPVYWGGLLLCVAAALFYQPVAAVLRDGMMAAVLLPIVGRGDGFAYPANPVAWTLVWELAVNLLYAAVLWRFGAKRLAVIVGVGLAVATVFAFHNPRGWSFGMTNGDVWWAATRALPEFLIGVLLRRAYAAGGLEKLPRVTPLLPLLAWLSIAVLPQGLSPLVDLAAVLVSPLPIAFLVRGEGLRGFALLGVLSYPLYASHLAWIGLARHTPLFGLNDHANPLAASGMVVIALATAWLLSRLDPAAPAVMRFRPLWRLSRQS